MPHFRTVGIIGKHSDALEVEATLRRLCDYLRGRACQVLPDPEAARLLGLNPEDGLPVTVLGARCDLVVVGRGRRDPATRRPRPGRQPGAPGGHQPGAAGFPGRTSCRKISRPPWTPSWTASTRPTPGRLLSAALIGDPTEGRAYAALNDVVIHKWNTARMIEFETYIDGVFVNAQRSDGLIVSTPTGSTAYALSGGGPLMDPALDAILLVPICPHDLSNRPLVVPGNRCIEIRVCGHAQGQAQMTCDGQTEVPLPPRSAVRITRHPDHACLLHPKGHDHYQILRAKLGWGGHSQVAVPC